MYAVNFYNTNEIAEIIKKLRRLIRHIEEQEDEEYQNLLKKAKEIYNDIIKKRDEIKLLLQTTNNNLTDEILNKLRDIQSRCEEIDALIDKFTPYIDSTVDSNERITKKVNKLVILLGGYVDNADTSDSISNKLKRGVEGVTEQVADIFNRKKTKLEGHTKNLKTANKTNTDHILDYIK